MARKINMYLASYASTNAHKVDSSCILQEWTIFSRIVPLRLGFCIFFVVFNIHNEFNILVKYEAIKQK